LERIVCDDPEGAAREAARRLAAAARAGGSIVLTGGSTPRRAYELAAGLEPDWSRVELWWGDERCVPPDDERSNYRLARESLLEQLGAPPADVHRIRGELGATAAAEEYDRALEGVRLDLVLLGLGSDGHAASLFPNAPTLDERERRAVAAEAGLEPFVDRVTLTVPELSSAMRIVWLVTGTAKAQAVRRAFAEAPTSAVPASLIRSSGGADITILDQEAAAGLGP
jgi:6-phosphogluconolactonase